MVDTLELEASDLQKQAIQDSVQKPPEVSKNGAMTGALSWGMSQRTSFLPPWGTRECERSLNLLWFMTEMALPQGAIAGICKNVATTPWEIKGDDTPAPLFRDMGKALGFKSDNGVEYYQQVLRLADFGAGWGSFISKLAMAFFRFNGGGFGEVIAPGDPYAETTGAVTGVAYLDPLRCLPTGDPRYPVLYYDRTGGMHVMHHTRVMQLQDMPQGDESFPGYGMCALYRAASIAYRQIWMTRYINAYLDDQPKPGILAVSGITKPAWDEIEAKYQSELERDTTSKWGRVIRYHSAGANVEAKFQLQAFSEAPEKFSFRDYMEIDVDLLALVMGVDRQELWQLSGGNIGSAEQSAILHQKSRGKTIGYLITEIERKINDLLPVDYEFAFKYQDESEALQEAQKANFWADFTSKTTTLLNPQEGKTLLANQVSAVQNAISNAPRVNDMGVQPATTITAPDDTVGAQDIAPAAETVPERLVLPEKSYHTTQSVFLSDLRSLVKSAVEGEGYLGRYSFGIRMRNLLKDYGLLAYKDGMQQGGVFVDELDDEDNNDYQRVFVDQSGYIGSFSDDIYVRKAVTLNNLDTRVAMWGKSLQAFVDSGQVAASANGMYRWETDPLKESCVTCLRMNGQVHRMKAFYANNILPKSSALACRGFLCGCKLVRTSEKARGRF
jgi:hypothetical protein